MSVSIPDPQPVVDDAIAALILAAPLRNIVIHPTPNGSGEITANDPTFTGDGPAYTQWYVYINGALDTTGSNGGIIRVASDGHWEYTCGPRINGTYSFQPVGGVPVTFIINNPTQPLTDESGSAAAFDYAPAFAIYYAGGVAYGDASALLAATGLAFSGTSGYTNTSPYIVGTNIISNGTFTSNTTGWQTTQGSIAAVGGELQFTPTAATNGAWCDTTPTDPDASGSGCKAYLAEATIHRGTTVQSLVLLGASQNNSAAGIGSTSVGTTTPTAVSLYFATHQTQSFNRLALKNTSGSADGNTLLMDNVSMRHVKPFQAWPTGAYSFHLDFTTGPSTPSVNEVIYQAGIQSERDTVKIIRGNDKNVQVIVTFNNLSQAALSMGVVENSTRCRIAVAMGNTTYPTPPDPATVQQQIVASMNGQLAISVAAGTKSIPGPSHLWLKRGLTASLDFQGTLNRCTVFSGHMSAQYAQYLSGKHLINGTPSTSMIAAGGDSYIGGASGVVLSTMLTASNGRPIINIGVGGSTMANVKAVIQARPFLRDMTWLIWDGSANSYGSVAAYYALIDNIYEFINHDRIVFIPPTACGPSNDGSITAYTQDMINIYNLLVADGRHTFNPQTALANATAPVTAQDIKDDSAKVIRQSALVDTAPNQVHLGLTAMGTIRDYAASFLTSLGI